MSAVVKCTWLPGHWKLKIGDRGCCATIGEWMSLGDRLSMPESAATSSIVRYYISSYQASYLLDNNRRLEFVWFPAGVLERFHLSMFLA